MGCMYCDTENDYRESLMEKLLDLPYSTVYLFKNQRYYGRCVVAFRLYHAAELFELKPDELAGYAADVAAVAKAVKAVSGASKINYAIYGDIAQHVHVHVVPKQEGGEDWGTPFQLGGNDVLLDEPGWSNLRLALLSALAH